MKRMTLKISKQRPVGALLQDFSDGYPFLRLDVYRALQGRLGSSVKQKLSKSMILGRAGVRKEGEFDVFDSMTVRQLEQDLYSRFGLAVRVSRLSGKTWLEASISDSWTLKQQNDHGQELSGPV